MPSSRTGRRPAAPGVRSACVRPDAVTNSTSGTSGPYRLLASQDLFHGPALRQFVHQLVQVPDVAHQRVFDLLDSDAADDAGDLAGIRMQRRRFAEEGLEVLLPFDLLRERCRTVARQPADPP